MHSIGKGLGKKDRKRDMSPDIVGEKGWRSAEALGMALKRKSPGNSKHKVKSKI